MRAAIYCRLSEEDRNKRSETDDSNSIQNQKTMLIQYAQGRGWQIFDIYSDDDYAGSDRGRPQFNRLLKDAEAGRFDIVLCKTQSRFTRELELVEKYIHGLFPLWGIRFVSIVDNADTDNKGNKKSRQINGLVNEWYLEDMSENIRSVLDSRRQSGFHIGAFAPYGYSKDPQRKGHLIIDPEAATVVREIFTLYAGGCGKTGIARLLNDRGVPNPSEYKRLNGFRYKNGAGRGTLWKYCSISEILENEVYIGNLIQGKHGSVSYKTRQNRAKPKEQWIRVEGTHEPIIDHDLWNRVQKQRQARVRPTSSGRVGIFAGKVKCRYCGYYLRTTKNRERHYLQCQTRFVSKNACAGSFIPVRELEQILLRQIRKLSAELLDQDALKESIHVVDDPSARKAAILAEIKACERRAGEYARGLQALYLDKVRGVITEKDYATFSASFSTEQERLENRIRQCRETLSEIEHQTVDEDPRRALMERYLHMPQLSREVVDMLVDHIVIGRRDRITKRVPAEIHWNF